MTVDFPIGTRLIINGNVFEVVKDCTLDGCCECAAKNFIQYSICHCLRCARRNRRDGEAVHWKLIKGSV